MQFDIELHPDIPKYPTGALSEAWYHAALGKWKLLNFLSNFAVSEGSNPSELILQRT